MVLDTCALVHAKEMRALRCAPLELLGALGAAGCVFVDTPKVRGEKIASSLRETLDGWDKLGLLDARSATLQERRTAESHLRPKDKTPGKEDMGLIAIATALGAPLLTHDGAASVLAGRCGVVVLDLIDLAALVARLGLVDLDEVDAAWGTLDGFVWPLPHHRWEGSVKRTLAARPKLDAVLDRLTAG